MSGDTGYAETVSGNRDDDAPGGAFSWEGDDDPTLARPGRAGDRRDRLPAGFTAVGKGSEDVGSGEALDPAPDDVREAANTSAGVPGERRPAADAALVAVGIFAGIYALYTAGWIVGGMRLQAIAQFLVSPLASVPAVWLAVLAPALWFTGALWFTRGRPLWHRFVWLVAGAAVLVPWPFVLVGAVGA